MKRKIDARKAIKKLRAVQMELKEINIACIYMDDFCEVEHIIQEIQSIKRRLDIATGDPIFI